EPQGPVRSAVPARPWRRGRQLGRPGVAMALDFSCQVQRHPLSVRGSDCYETPPAATRALLAVETLPHRIWEPCVGKGASYPGGVDFLMERSAPLDVDCIVSNPPSCWRSSSLRRRSSS